MKYYKIEVKSLYENKNKLAPRVDGVEKFESFYDLMDKGILEETPVFEDFYLTTLQGGKKKKSWEWMRGDIHRFVALSSLIPGWFVSRKLKELFQEFNIAEPHKFYPSKLLYKEQNYDYYIFQYHADDFHLKLMNKVNYANSIFYDSVNKKEVFCSNMDDYLSKCNKNYKNTGKSLILKKLCLKEFLDFFPMKFLMLDIVSERLKNAMEENGIIGFEFSELDYEVLVDTVV